jgi:hypothetical protein
MTFLQKVIDDDTGGTMNDRFWRQLKFVLGSSVPSGFQNRHTPTSLPSR